VSSAVKRAKKRRRSRIFQVNWKANPAIRCFRKKRKDQTKRESGDNPNWDYDKRLWKRRVNGRGRLVQDRHIGKGELAL
jgi:hypothetical protein